MSPDSFDPLAGLDSAEASRRLVTHGPNRLPPAPRRRLSARVWAQLSDPMILLLVAAGTLTMILGDAHNTIIIAAVVVLNTVIGVGQEVRAEKAIAALDSLTAPFASVLRDGEPVQVPAHEVVPGDILRLAAGDLVSADATVLSAHRLQLDRSAMTGESQPVDVFEQEEVTAGTLVTQGRAVASVTRTGPHSGLGRLALLIADTPNRPTPLQRRLANLSRGLVVAVAALTAVVVVIGLAQGRSLAAMAVLGVSLAVAAVPESLPAVVAVSLAMGAHRMARRDAVVRKLPAVETLGSVSVIATDKTGTLTEGRMVAERVWTPAASYIASGLGYEPMGSLRMVGEPSSSSEAASAPSRLLRDVALCNDARLSRGDDGWGIDGDTLEGALLVLAARGGQDLTTLPEQWPRVAEEPFDHLTRLMRTWHSGPDGASLVVCKGAPEAILALLPPSDEVRLAGEAAEKLAGEGFRVIAVADHQSGTAGERGTEPLGLVGLVGIDDPPRPQAGGVVAQCRRAGIRLILITGDHPGTARAIAERTGIIDAATDDSDSPIVYSRVQPEQKLDIVRDLQDRGEVVAMLGDGVNDAPALRRADIGVAAGRGGTEVARQAADLVLLDDDLGSVVAAVEEGRRIFTNIRTFLVYAVSGGLAEVGVMLAGPFIGVAQPLLPAQILWINLVTHGLTGVAFGGEPADPADMARPPRPPGEPVFTRPMVRRLMLATTCLIGVSLVAGALASGHATQRTAVFLTLGLGQLGVALALRARTVRRGLRVRGLDLAVAAAALLQVGGTLLPPLHELLGTVPLTSGTMLTGAVLAAVPGLAVGVVVRRERHAALRASSFATAPEQP